MTRRAATRDDLDAIMALERAAFPTDAWSRTAMAAELASPHGRYLVDEEDGRIVGYGGVRAVRGASDADIQTIALEPRVRGAGRGRALLRALLEEARERGAREMFLEVRADNPVACGLYVSEGFVEIARRPRYYQPDDVDAIVMQRSLVARSQEDAAVPGPVAPELPLVPENGSVAAHGSIARSQEDAAVPGPCDPGPRAVPENAPTAGEERR